MYITPYELPPFVNIMTLQGQMVCKIVEAANIATAARGKAVNSNEVILHVDMNRYSSVLKAGISGFTRNSALEPQARGPRARLKLSKSQVYL
jgi:hypothetical protein